MLERSKLKTFRCAVYPARFVFHAITDDPIWRELSNNIIQKGLAFIGDWSGTMYRSGHNVRFGILPRRPGGRGGASVVRRMAPR